MKTKLSSPRCIQKTLTQIPAIATVFLLPAVASLARDVPLLNGHPLVQMADGVGLTDDHSLLTIRATENRKVPIFVIQKPEVSKTGYMLKGEVRHENVGGEGMLEMWNFFPMHDDDGNVVEGREGYFFSRTAGEYGPMQKLNGTSGWRPFILPFNPGNLGHPPKRLEVNALLPDGGTVMLRNLELVDWQPPSLSATAEANTTPKAWWVASVTGVLIALLVLVLAGLTFWLRRRHVEKELRRISVADTNV